MSVVVLSEFVEFAQQSIVHNSTLLLQAVSVRLTLFAGRNFVVSRSVQSLISTNVAGCQFIDAPNKRSNICRFAFAKCQRLCRYSCCAGTMSSAFLDYCCLFADGVLTIDPGTAKHSR